MSSSINVTVRIVRLELVPIAVGFLISVNGVLIVGVGPLFGKTFIFIFLSRLICPICCPVNHFFSLVVLEGSSFTRSLIIYSKFVR